MSYLGIGPQIGEFPSQIITATGTNGYELNFSTVSQQGLLVFLNGAIQAPGVHYTAASTTLTFSSNVPAGVQILVIGLGQAKTQVTVGAGVVGAAEVNSTIFANTAQSLAGTRNDRAITPFGLDYVFDSIFTSSKSTNGYQQIAGGLILQWGRAGGGNAPNPVVVTFPILFPVACLNVQLSQTGTPAEEAHPTVLSFDRFNTSLRKSSIAADLMWFAIGY